MSTPAHAAERIEPRRVEGQPRVIVTRRLLPAAEARMGELFDARFNADDHWPVEACAIYWHYVDVIWVFFYPALYLIGTAVH